MKKGFSLIEVVISCIVLGILVTFAVPQFVKVRERHLDKISRGYLSDLQAAERLYFIEVGYYFPASGSTSDPAVLNSVLKVELPTSNSNWTYTVTNSGAAGNVTAVRNRGGAAVGRTWTLDRDPTTGTFRDKPTCTSSGSDNCLE